MTHNVLFRASLSNGETFTEDKDIHGDDTGSPWTRLCKYAEENNLTITSLALVTPNGQTFNLPSAGNNPKFKVAETEKPLSYMVKRSIARNMYLDGRSEVADHFTIAVAQYEAYRLEVWVDEKNPRNSWSLVR